MEGRPPQLNLAIFPRDGHLMRLRASSHRHPGTAAIGLLTALAILCAGRSWAQTDRPDSFFQNRPAFARAEQDIKQPASCEDISGQLPPEVPRDTRIDMAINGAVSLIQTDGALWYIAVCAEPGVRVLCVTYEANGLKLGDKAVLRGGYSRQNPRHIMLDPCLASPEVTDRKSPD